jgi:hypothetical protein
MVRAGTSPDEELAVTRLRISKADDGHSFSYSLPRLRIAGPLTGDLRCPAGLAVL